MLLKVESQVAAAVKISLVRVKLDCNAWSVLRVYRNNRIHDEEVRTTQNEVLVRDTISNQIQTFQTPRSVVLFLLYLNVSNELETSSSDTLVDSNNDTASIRIPSSPTPTRPISAAHRGKMACSSAPIRPISSWHT